MAGVKGQGEIQFSKTGNKYYKKKLENTKKHNSETYDQIILRVPKGMKQKINDFVRERADQEPDNPKYNDLSRLKPQPSVNGFILSLIEESTGLKLKN